MKKTYEKPVTNIVDFKFEEKIMNVGIEGDGTFTESVPDEY